MLQRYLGRRSSRSSSGTSSFLVEERWLHVIESLSKLFVIFLYAIAEDDSKSLIVLTEIGGEPAKTAAILQSYREMALLKCCASTDANVETP